MKIFGKGPIPVDSSTSSAVMAVKTNNAYRILRIDLSGINPELAILTVYDGVAGYTIPISVNQLHEMDLNVGGMITLEVKPEGK